MSDDSALELLGDCADLAVEVSKEIMKSIETPTGCFIVVLLVQKLITFHLERDGISQQESLARAQRFVDAAKVRFIPLSRGGVS